MSVLTRRSQRAALMAAILCMPSLAGAQGGAVAPSPISQPSPAQASNAAGEPVDGWAIVRYSVLADGTTSNIRVIETVPPSVDAEPIREAVAGWRFQPARSGADAIDWHNGESVVTFGDDELGTPSDEFEAAFNQVVSLTEQSQFAQAYDAARSLLDRQATERVELGRAVAQLATIYILRDSPHRALSSLQLVTDARITVLPLEDLFTALQIKIGVETELGRVQEALATHALIAAGLDPNAEDPFATVANTLRAHWESTPFLEVSGRIDDKPWRFDVGRRYFYFDKISGEIDSIDVECDTRRISIDFEPDAEFQLPDSFGDCTLFVNGSPGTTFSYVDVLPPED